MYNYIIDPHTKQIININSKKGKIILKKYIKSLIAGSVIVNKKLKIRDDDAQKQRNKSLFGNQNGSSNLNGGGDSDDEIPPEIAESKEELDEWMEYKPSSPTYRLVDVTDEQRNQIENFLTVQRDILFHRYFRQGLSDEPGNLFNMEEDGEPMSIADVSNQTAINFPNISNRIAETDSADNIENMSNEPGAANPSSIIHPSTERVAERLGVYERLLTALVRNSFTNDDRDRMLELNNQLNQWLELNDQLNIELNFDEL